MSKALEFLKRYVKQWPDKAERVRLDKDGEICFEGDYCDDYDFYPDAGYSEYTDCFDGGRRFGIGRTFTKEEVMS